MREEKSSRLENGIANVIGKLYKNLHDDQEHEEAQQENEENKSESSIDVHNKDTRQITRIPEITTQKKANLLTATESEPKTSKQCVQR